MGIEEKRDARRLSAHLRSGLPHGDADVGLLRRGRVVHGVSIRQKAELAHYERGDVDGSASGPQAEAAAGTLAASASLADRLLTLRRGRIRR